MQALAAYLMTRSEFVRGGAMSAFDPEQISASGAYRGSARVLKLASAVSLRSTPPSQESWTSRATARLSRGANRSMK